MKTTHTHSTFITIGFTCLLFLCIPLAALGITLDQAKQQGLLGERPDGYLGLAQPTASPDTVNLMKDINRKRRDVYRKIAAKDGTTLQVVEALAGKKAIQKTTSGELIMLPNGTWTPKP